MAKGVGCSTENNGELCSWFGIEILVEYKKWVDDSSNKDKSACVKRTLAPCSAVIVVNHGHLKNNNLNINVGIWKHNMRIVTKNLYQF